MSHTGRHVLKKTLSLSTIYIAMLMSGVANSALINIDDESLTISDDQSSNSYNVNGSSLSMIGSSSIIGSDPTKAAITINTVRDEDKRSTISINGGTVNGIIDGMITNNAPGSDFFIQNGTINGKLLVGVSPKSPAGEGYNTVNIIDSTINSSGSYKGIGNAIKAQSVENFLLSNSEVNHENGTGINIQQFSGIPSSNISTIDKSTISVKNGTGIFAAHDNLDVTDTTINVGISPDAGDITLVAIQLLTGATNNPQDLYVSQLKLNNSTINSDSAGVYLSNSDAKISGSKINANKIFGVRTTGGNLSLAQSTEINSTGSAVGLSVTTNSRSTNTGQRLSNINISDTQITAEKNAALAVSSDVIAKIKTWSKTVLSSGGQQAVTIAKNADVQMQMDNSQIRGDVSIEKGGKLDLNLLNKTLFMGAAQNIDTLSVSSDSHWDMTDNSFIGSLNNIGGRITFSPSSIAQDNSSFKTLHVASNYHGDNAQLIMNTQLGDDDSPTDKLVIEGNTSGETHVKVNNLGGTGNITQKGIELITVKGNSDGEFKQDGRIVAGVYDYFLGRGADNKGTDNKNWYLTSEL
ncbi:autotransporter outer membrane beta-barrel domain-containing protein, partial [Enterobacter bugandensis]